MKSACARWAQVGEDALVVGGAVTLTRLDGALEQLQHALPAERTRAFGAVREQLKYFAGIQIRNAAAIGGNIVTGSPISDLNPLLMACRAVFTVQGQGLPERQARPALLHAQHAQCCQLAAGWLEQVIDRLQNMSNAMQLITAVCCGGVGGQVRAEDFFLGYRKVDLGPSEVLLRVALPCTRPGEFVREFKQAHRRDDDIAIVNAGMRVRLAQSSSGVRCLPEPQHLPRHPL
jgi:xanthine dehydrogenase/oxidase